MQLTDKYGLSAAVARKRAGLPPLHSLSLKSGQENAGAGGQVNLAPCEAKNIEDVEVLPIDELFSDKPVNMTQVNINPASLFCKNEIYLYCFQA